MAMAQALTAERIVAMKRGVGDRRAAFAAVDGPLLREVAEVAALAAAGEAVVPEVDYAAIAAGTLPDAMPSLIRRRGCVVVRGVFAPEQASEWDREIAHYLLRNDADARSRAARPGRWASGPPQMYSIYWSAPQIQARQDARLAAVRAWLNRLWRFHGWFDPDRECTYADRIRRRTPGDVSLALGPHLDGGARARWLDPQLRLPYAPLLAGAADQFDPFDAAHRPAVPDGTDGDTCSAFRTWQGWTALSAQGPRDGTLQVLPITRAVAWVLLRPLCDDIAEDALCGAETGAALWITPQFHAPLLPALVPIPHVAPGDTVWWHPDLIHAVEAKHEGTALSNVMYIAAAPDCARNRAYLARQLPAFLAGLTPPDFPPDDLETDFAGRARAQMLNELGRMQMGIA